MNWLLIIVALVLIWRIAEGAERGMVKEVISFVSLVVLCLVVALIGTAVSKYMDKDIKDITNEEIFKVHELVHSQDDVFNDYIKEEVIKIKEESERKNKLIEEKQKEEKEIQQEKEQDEIEK